jgi:hypothetical protein
MSKRIVLLAGAVAVVFRLLQPISGGAQDAPQPAPSAETPFLSENGAAMDKMMAGMEVKPTGDVDADFATIMIAHHQGAIEMATAELRYGRNEQLRRISQEIIIDQQQEIAAMRLALGLPPPPAATAPTQVPGASPPGASTPAGAPSMSPSMKMQ